MRIHESLVKDLQGFARLWERICEDLQDFGRVFVWIHKALEEDSQGLKNILKIIYCYFLKPFYHFLFDFNFGCLLGVIYPIHLLQHFATKVAPKIKTNSIMILYL